MEKILKPKIQNYLNLFKVLAQKFDHCFTPAIPHRREKVQKFPKNFHYTFLALNLDA